MNPQIPEEFIKAMDVQNQNPVRVEKNSMQKNSDNDKTKSHNDKTRSYAVQLGSSTLIFSKINESPIPEAYQKQIIDQLCQMEQQKKMYHQVVTEEPSSTSKDIAIQIRGGDLGKASSPGARALVMHVRLSLINQKLLNQNQEEVVLRRLGRQILRNAHGQQQRIVWDNNLKLVQLKVGMGCSGDFQLDRLQTHLIQGAQVDRDQ